MAFTLTSVSTIPDSARLSDIVSTIQGVSLAIAGFMMPNNMNIIRRIHILPVRMSSIPSFLRNALNCLIFLPPP